MSTTGDLEALQAGAWKLRTEFERQSTWMPFEIGAELRGVT
jgi:hypothetical protein